MTTATVLSEEQLGAQVRQALVHIGRQEFVTAERLLSAVVAERPQEGRTLDVLGLLRLAQTRLLEAEGYFRGAVAAEPTRPEFHLHLGRALQASGQIEEAITAHLAAIALEPDLPDAHFELGMAYSCKGDLVAAEREYCEASRLHPGFLAARHAWGAALVELGRPIEAEAVARSALPQMDRRWHAEFLHNVAIARAEQHRYEEALCAYDEALSVVPTLPMAQHNRANALQALGRTGDAEAGYRSALAQNPLEWMSHRGLNQLLRRCGRDDYLRSYADTAKLVPTLPIPYIEKGRLLLLDERPAEAHQSFSRALEIAPGDPTAREGCAAALTALGRHGEAIAEFEGLLELAPQSVGVRIGLAQCLLRAGEGARARGVAEEAVALAPHNQTGLALLNTALRLDGSCAEAALGDYDRFVRVFDLGPPDGFPDLPAFHDAASSFLTRLHGAPPGGGADDQDLISRTQGSLLGGGSEVMACLRARLEGAIASYVNALPESGSHPFLSRRQGAVRYVRSWSTRVASGGSVPNHVHDGGWISAIYCVALPHDAFAFTNAYGWPKFGEPPFEAHLPDPVFRTVRPLPGRLILFPSYLWHGSVAAHSHQPRLTIAFDLVPEASAASGR